MQGDNQRGERQEIGGRVSKPQIGVKISRGCEIQEITADSVVYTKKGERQEIPARQVIIAMGAEPDSSLEEQLAGSGTQVHRIGDCRDKSFIDGAILDARKLVQQLA